MKKMFQFVMPIMILFLGITGCKGSGSAPVRPEEVRDYVMQYMQLITDGDAAELARFLRKDGEITDDDMTVVQRVAAYYTPYDLRRASVQSVDYNDAERQYSVVIRDGFDEEITVFVSYGDDLMHIDLRMFEEE